MELVYVKVFLDWREALEPFSDAERGRLFTALLDYARTGEVPQLVGNERFIFPMMKASLDRDNETLKELSNKRSECGKLGGRPKKTNEANESNENQKKQKVFSETKKSIEKEKEKEKEEDKDKDKEYINLTFSDEKVCRTKDVRRVQEAWNELGLQKITKILPDTVRGKMLKRRVLEYGVDKVLEAIGNIRGSPFLMGNNSKGWIITFDWFIRPNNFPKVLEGNYSENLADGGAESAKNGKFGSFEVPTQNDYERMKDMLNDLKGG